MIIILKPHSDEAALDGVLASIAALGLQSHVSRGIERTLIGVIGDERLLQISLFDGLPGVDRVLRVLDGYRLVSREFQRENSEIRIGRAAFGTAQWQLMLAATPNESDLETIAGFASQQSCAGLIADSFLLNDNPYGKSGNGLLALEKLASTARNAGLSWLSPLQDVRLLDTYLEADPDAILLAGRSASDVVLLKEVGRINKPVVLARPPRATPAEWLMAAEHIAIGGNHRIILCEQGEQTESAERGLAAISEIPLLKRESHLPVLLAPCSPAVTADIAANLALAGMVAGADGLLLQASSRSTLPHALSLPALAMLQETLRGIAPHLGRKL